MSGRVSVDEQLALPVGPDDCLDCAIDVHALGEYAMLHDAVWLEAHPANHGMLCVGCVEHRLGRQLVARDFAPVPVNRLDGWQPKSPRLRARLTA